MSATPSPSAPRRSEDKLFQACLDVCVREIERFRITEQGAEISECISVSAPSLTCAPSVTDFPIAHGNAVQNPRLLHATSSTALPSPQSTTTQQRQLQSIVPSLPSPPPSPERTKRSGISTGAHTLTSLYRKLISSSRHCHESRPAERPARSFRLWLPGRAKQSSSPACYKYGQDQS